MKRYFLIICLVLITGCASNPEARKEVAVQESARLTKTTQPLSAFSHFQLLPISASSAVSEQEKKMVVVKQLEQKLQTILEPLLSDWNANTDSSSGKTLLIKPKVVMLRVVSGGARFWAGALAGDSSIQMDLELVEKDTNQLIAMPRINKSANAMAGAWSIGASDKNLMDYIADISAQYLKDNYQK